ncbi:MAG: ParB/RepB/Spo0J family partition protein [Thermodesulfobacteriota bacterium]
MKHLQRIYLQEIDFSDETFSVNFKPDLDRLRSSIEKRGLIQPILLKKKGKGYQIVCGFRRLNVLKELERSEISAFILEEEKKSEVELFVMTVEENLTTRGFNTVEKAIALHKLVQDFKVDSFEVIHTYLPLLSLEPNEKILHSYLSLAQMEEEVKDYVLKEEVSRSNIRRLSALSPEDRKVLIPFLSLLKLGENRLREVLTLLDEISRREKKKVREIVCRSDIQTIVSRKGFTPSQKTEQIKRILLELRYPRMMELEREFEKKRRELNLPSNVSLHPSPYFEGREWRVEFRFETIKEYRSTITSLLQLGEKKRFEEMLEFPP